MKKSLKVLLSTSALSFVLCLFFAGQVFADSYFNGGWKLYTSNNGGSATIETQNPTVVSGCSAWAMTDDSNIVGDYAQVGYRKAAGYSNPKYFYEYMYIQTNTWDRTELGTAATGSNNNFKVGNDSTTMYFVINGTTYGTVPLSTIPFERNTVEFAAETHDTNDKCPGTISNPVSIGSCRIKDTSNNWSSVICYVTSGTPGYGTINTMRNNISSSGASNWEIWDSRVN